MPTIEELKNNPKFKKYLESNQIDNFYNSWIKASQSNKCTAFFVQEHEVVKGFYDWLLKN